MTFEEPVSLSLGLMACGNDFPAFLLDLVSNPLTCVLTVAVIFMLISQTPAWPWFLGLVKGRRNNA